MIWRYAIPSVAGISVIAIIIYLVPGTPKDWLAFLSDPQTGPEIFILLMLLLPLIGFPITPFLILVGVKFGPMWATVITSAVFMFHLVISYILAHSLLRPHIKRLLNHLNYKMPEIHARRRWLFSFIFMAVPGLPYTVKNYTLAALNIPFVIYLTAGLLCNAVLALPFIGLGSSIIDNPRIAVIFVILLGVAYALTHLLRRRTARRK